MRFAPSPTGYLHIGGARTALFNWLWARKHKGVFILRVEDTDRARSTEESIAAITESMQWLGLHWQEGPEVGGSRGPYFQTQRTSLYRELAEEMVERGAAYRCYCTREELSELREAHAQTGSKDAWRYPGIWRDRTDWPEGKPYVVRLRAPQEGETRWVDRVKGPLSVPNATLQDVVLLRQDGIPIYNFGAAVDDALMDITLVARGDDHVINTPLQILIYRALERPTPDFAHLPMILAPNGEKLSKRHASVSVLDYRDQGYLPEAVLNYLARLGWSHGDQEIFTLDELIAAFDWMHVGQTGARYDAKKFAHVQAEHLRSLGSGELLERAKPFFAAADITPTPAAERAIETVRVRATTLCDLPAASDFYFRPPIFDEKAKAKFLNPKTVPFLSGLCDMLAHAEAFDAVSLEGEVKKGLEERDWSLKHVAQPARVALTGRTQSPGLFEMMDVLGKEQTLQRLQTGLELAREA